ncbi:hypothetical protein [Sinorhizobium meliloti]|uniref:Uncharacterized protein n=1 Tax=Rhizobium meliloti TaxID=382 RepID=A0A2J0YU26_RHIML|nr:hypothetical protein [Sinorhizobium meliloti]PJR09903.1 hypothetical protein CEJ86_30290 [Sinorhizobium meliloti]
MRVAHFVAVFCGSLFAAGPVLAHSPLISCFYDDETTITCEAGYSDGASAAGGVIRVVDGDERLLTEGRFSENSTFTLKKPESPVFQIIFIGDTAHEAGVFNDEIF